MTLPSWVDSFQYWSWSDMKIIIHAKNPRKSAVTSRTSFIVKDICGSVSSLPVQLCYLITCRLSAFIFRLELEPALI